VPAITFAAPGALTYNPERRIPYRPTSTVVVGATRGGSRALILSTLEPRLRKLCGFTFVERIQVGSGAQAATRSNPVQDPCAGSPARCTPRREQARNMDDAAFSVSASGRPRDERRFVGLSPARIPVIAPEARVVEAGGDAEIASYRGHRTAISRNCSRGPQNPPETKQLPSSRFVRFYHQAPRKPRSQGPLIALCTSRLRAGRLRCFLFCALYAQGHGLQLRRSSGDRARVRPCRYRDGKIASRASQEGHQCQATPSCAGEPGDPGYSLLISHEENEDVEGPLNRAPPDATATFESVISLTYSLRDSTGVFEKPDFALSPPRGEPAHQLRTARGEAESIELLGDRPYRSDGFSPPATLFYDVLAGQGRQMDLDFTPGGGPPSRGTCVSTGVPRPSRPRLDFSLNTSEIGLPFLLRSAAPADRARYSPFHIT